MIEIIDLGLVFLQAFLATNKNKLPTQVVAAIQATIDALIAHKSDLLTKAAFEAERG